MTLEEVTSAIESFVRDTFSISSDDAYFTREADVFEGGYVDSVGFVELLSFIDSKFAVEIAETELLSEDFSTVAGIARIVHRTRNELAAPKASLSLGQLGQLA